MKPPNLPSLGKPGLSSSNPLLKTRRNSIPSGGQLVQDLTSSSRKLSNNRNSSYGSFRNEKKPSRLRGSFVNRPPPILAHHSKVFPEHNICVRLLTNHGNPNQISIGQMNFLGTHFTSTSIESYSVLPLQATQDSYKILFENVFDKQSMEKIWKADFFEPVQISINIRTPDDIKSIRFFNSPLQGDTAAKDVEVYYDGHLACKVELASDFGTVARFSKDDENTVLPSKEVYPLHKLASSDAFGTFPQYAGKSLNLCVMETYGPTDLFGISGIALYGPDKNMIPGDKIDSVILNNCRGYTIPSEVVFNTPIQDHVKKEPQDFFVFTNIALKPSIEIKFLEPIVIGSIEITNYSGELQTREIAMKKVKLSLDGIPIWIGKLNPLIKIPTGINLIDMPTENNVFNE